MHRNMKFSNGKEVVELSMKIIEQWNRLPLKMCLKKSLSCWLRLHLKEISFNFGGGWLLYSWFKCRYRCGCSKWLELNIVGCYFSAKWFNGGFSLKISPTLSCKPPNYKQILQLQNILQILCFVCLSYTEWAIG